MLNKRHRTANSDWLRAYKNIREIISKEEIDKLELKAIKEISQTVKGKKVAYAWSGGKDGAVLSHICEKLNITNGVHVKTNLEYPAVERWIEENKPKGVQIINTGQNLEWLANNLDMLFPRNSRVTSRWYKIVQHRGQDIYFKENNLDIIILGRRKADDNYVGRGTNIYTNGLGITRYSPLSEWKHEHILAYIFYNGLNLSPIYRWKNGFLIGTHPWAAREETKTIENGWKEVYEIDKTVVEKAADKIPSARKFLDSI